MKTLEFEGITCISTKLEVARFPRSKELRYLVLESDPRPGYYSKGNFPENKKHVFDHHLYLLIKNPVSCFQDVVLRYSAKLNTKSELPVHVFPGQMTFLNMDYQCIRVRTSDIDQMPELIADLKTYGISFLKDRKVNPFVSSIQYKNYIVFKEMYEGIYQNKLKPHRFFIKMPGFIDFDAFSNIIQQVKDNCDFHLFDASHASIYYRDSVLDFARIYSRHCDEKRLPEFKDKLEQVYSKVVKDQLKQNIWAVV